MYYRSRESKLFYSVFQWNFVWENLPTHKVTRIYHDPPFLNFWRKSDFKKLTVYSSIYGESNCFKALSLSIWIKSNLIRGYFSYKWVSDDKFSYIPNIKHNNSLGVYNT